MGQASKRPALIGGSFLALVLVIDLWCATAGTWRFWPTYSNDYSLLASGFLHGKLSLPIQPPPALLALPNPYDRNARRAPGVHDLPVSIHDLVLYKRKFYLAWGPVPALAMAAAALMVGQRQPNWGDQYPTFAFTFGTVALATFLLTQIRRRLYPEQGAWTVLPPLVSQGVGTPLLWIVTRGAAYEAAIGGGQFFLLAGLCAAWMGLVRPRPHAGWLALASACWALSMGSRISLPPAVGAVAMITLIHLFRRHSGRAGVVSVVLPLIAGSALLGYYNFARFHSYTEFGFRYQLTGTDQSKPLASGFLSLGNVPPNLLVYLFAPPTWLGSFPFFHADSAAPLLKNWLRLPNYAGEPVVGLIWSQPFLCVLIPAFAYCRRGGIDESTQSDRDLRNWLIGSAALAGLMAAMPVLALDFSTMRYLADIVPCLTILAALAFWQTLRNLSPRPGLAKALAAVAGFVVIAQTLLAILLILDTRPTLAPALRPFYQNVTH